MARTAKSRASKVPLRQVFAKNVRMARVHIGMSQEGLANEADIDRAFVGTVERGQRNISIDYIELLATAIGLPPHDLLDPDLAERMGFDPTVLRSPRTARV